MPVIPEVVIRAHRVTNDQSHPTERSEAENKQRSNRTQFEKHVQSFVTLASNVLAMYFNIFGDADAQKVRKQNMCRRVTISETDYVVLRSA